jgi:hypothetical protein
MFRLGKCKKCSKFYSEPEKVYLVAKFGEESKKFVCSVPEGHLTCYDVEIIQIAKYILGLKGEEDVKVLYDNDRYLICCYCRVPIKKTAISIIKLLVKVEDEVLHEGSFYDSDEHPICFKKMFHEEIVQHFGEKVIGKNIIVAPIEKKKLI